MRFSAESKPLALTQTPSKIKIAPNHTAGKSFSTDALDWITVALSIAENIFLASLSKKHNNNLLDMLCQDVDTVRKCWRQTVILA